MARWRCLRQFDHVPFWECSKSRNAGSQNVTEYGILSYGYFLPPPQTVNDFGLEVGYTAKVITSWAATDISNYAKVVDLKVRELIKMLEQDGWFLVKTKGSHRQFKHPSKSGKVTVAGKLSVEVPPGTLNAVLKQVGLKK